MKRQIILSLLGLVALHTSAQITLILMATLALREQRVLHQRYYRLAIEPI